MERLRRARDWSKALRVSPSLEPELRLAFSRRAKLGIGEQPMVMVGSEKELPLLHPRRLPTNHQKFRIDPQISCGLMGPVWAVCDQCEPVEEDKLCVVVVSERKIRFDRYSKKFYEGLPAYRVTAILPKK